MIDSSNTFLPSQDGKSSRAWYNSPSMDPHNLPSPCEISLVFLPVPDQGDLKSGCKSLLRQLVQTHPLQTSSPIIYIVLQIYSLASIATTRSQSSNTLNTAGSVYLYPSAYRTSLLQPVLWRYKVFGAVYMYVSVWCVTCLKVFIGSVIMYTYTTCNYTPDR